MNLQDLIDKCREKGFLLNLSGDWETVEISVCHRDWVTNDLYQARACPSWRGKTLADIIPQVDWWLERASTVVSK